MLTIVLLCAAVLLLLAPLAVALAHRAAATQFVYGVSTIATAISLVAALTHLLGAASPKSIVLPLGVPWLGSHLRLDALSAFFLVVSISARSAQACSRSATDEHETAPERVLPFYPAFLAGMTLVVLADDAFTFLLSWEFMSLTSWAMVMSHHRVPENVRAGYVYLVMASFGTLALLLASACLPDPTASTPSRRCAPRIRRRRSARWR